MNAVLTVVGGVTRSGVFVVAVLGLATVAYLAAYNRLVTARRDVDDTWAVIEDELQRRHDLVPRLVSSVDGAAAHERRLLDDLVTKERAVAQQADLASVRSEPEDELTAAARAVLDLRERCPAVNSQANFLRLQHELSITEDRVGAARRYHNIKVADFNRRIETFPSNLVAAVHGFERASSFGSPGSPLPSSAVARAAGAGRPL